LRLALGIRYNGQAYEGWQSQRSGRTVQDKLEAALAKFTAQPARHHRHAVRRPHRRRRARR
jgi:tRNA pseudouridine38-40 synthase